MYAMYIYSEKRNQFAYSIYIYIYIVLARVFQIYVYETYSTNEDNSGGA